MGFLSSLFGTHSERILKELHPLVGKINALEESCATLSPEELKGRTLYFRKKISQGETLDELIPEIFACVREASKRTLGQRHFDVQLLGGLVMHRGGIAEMRTGEGKTLVATLPAYANALTGGVHVITVNDYLSRRDASWMGQIYDALGMKVSVLNHDTAYMYDPSHASPAEDEVRDESGSYKVSYDFLRPVSRIEAYSADIVYGTNSEFGFDYLRDNLEYDARKVRQTHHRYAIVDEIDSILIDEARTPLIISAPVADAERLYEQFARIAERLTREKDFTVDEKRRQIVLTDEGISNAERALGVGDIYTEKGMKYVHHLETAVKAKALYHKDKHYVVKNGEVVIVDEFTGRLQPGRRWSEGLHQAIEAKEGVSIAQESRTYASITYQNYFRMYDKLAGMTGTAETSAEEFYKVYGLETVVIPTNKPIARKDHPDLIFQTETGKFKAIARRVKELHTKGQPVLIGTVSIEKNELLSAYLSREGIPHKVLNAKNNEEEGGVIAQAGARGAVTIATNMAGRGVDIKLGGNPTTDELRDEVKNLGGLFVLGTERHEARRIDNQLRGRSGRQGDPGETQFFVSMEDDLMRVFASDMVKKMMGRLGIPEDEPIEHSLISKSLESAQEKIEGHNFDARKHVLQYDDVLNTQRTSLYAKRRLILEGGEEALTTYIDELVRLGGTPQEDVEKKKKELGDEWYPLMRQLILQTFDTYWVEHLEAMEYAQSSVSLRAYGQRDPLVEYRKEGLRLYKMMEASIAHDIISLIPHLQPTSSSTISLNHSSSFLTQEITQEEKVGRNDPCPCGAINPETGKPYKYKQCGLVNAPHHKVLGK